MIEHGDVEGTIMRVLGDDDLSNTEKLTMIAYLIHPNRPDASIAQLVKITPEQFMQVKRSLMMKDWLASPEG